jgi:hypothetical protein
VRVRYGNRVTDEMTMMNVEMCWKKGCRAATTTMQDGVCNEGQSLLMYTCHYLMLQALSCFFPVVCKRGGERAMPPARLGAPFAC